MAGKLMLWAVVILLAVVAVFLIFGDSEDLLAVQTGGACQNIYAYTPAFRCCDKVSTATGTYSLNINTAGAYWQCPPTAAECIVTAQTIPHESWQTTFFWWKGSTCSHGWLGDFSCTDAQVLPENTPTTISPAQYVYQNWGWLTLQYSNYDFKLCDCPTNPCGVPCPGVLGAAGCGFVTGENMYNEDGTLKQTGILVPGQGYSYTVPYGDCYAYYPQSNSHIIGDTCEECSTTNDCANRYPLQYNYGGKLYGAVCDGTHVQLYDCLATGGQACVKWRQDKNGNNVECLEYGQASRCDLFLAIPVQCCPGTSACGPQSFCNPDTYTCKQTAQCTQNYECGTMMMCDYTTKKLNTPVCQSGQCAFQEQTVQCCNDGNCAQGWYCSSDYTCKEKPVTKQQCIYECCQGEDYYFDRPCTSDKPVCCGEHVCRATTEECSYQPPVSQDNVMNWLWVPILALVFGAIGWLAGVKGAIIGAIMGGFIGFLIVQFLAMAWWQQLALLLGGGAIGALGIYALIIGLPFIIMLVAAWSGRK